MVCFFLRSHGIPENGVVHVPGLLVALFGTVTEIHQKQRRGHGAHARNSCETNEKLTQEERQNKKKKKAVVSGMFSPLLTARSKSDEFSASRRNWHEQISFKRFSNPMEKDFPALTRTKRTFSSCDQRPHGCCHNERRNPAAVRGDS